MIGEGFLYCLLEAFRFYRLHQIIDSIDFIAVQCIFRIGGRKDDEGSFGDGMCELYAGDTRHLNIQKDKIDRMFLHKLCGGYGIIEHAQ